MNAIVGDKGYLGKVVCKMQIIEVTIYIETFSHLNHFLTSVLSFAGIPFGSINLKYGVDENESKASFFLSPFCWL
jgi:hypothetical protein